MGVEISKRNTQLRWGPGRSHRGRAIFSAHLCWVGSLLASAGWVLSHGSFKLTMTCNQSDNGEEEKNTGWSPSLLLPTNFSYFAFSSYPGILKRQVEGREEGDSRNQAKDLCRQSLLAIFPGESSLSFDLCGPTWALSQGEHFPPVSCTLCPRHLPMTPSSGCRTLPKLHSC